jgi:DNA-binding GntR family transcriptional regulator
MARTANPVAKRKAPARKRSAKRADDGKPALPRALSSSLRSQHAYDALRDEIRSGALRPGDRLREMDIAARLGVSRTPAREALKRLESEGLVAFTQPRGLAVAQLSTSEIQQLYALREMLAGVAARFAAERAAPFEIDALEQMVARHKNVTNPEAAAAANRDLHAAIIAASHNVYVRRCFAVLSDAVALLGRTTYATPGRIASGWKENAEIIDAIARRDPDAAEDAARRHIRAAAAVRLAMPRDAD